MNQRVEKRGLFVVVDGLDGIGKGEIERALIQYEQRNGRACFDVVSWCRAHKNNLPELHDFWNPPYIYYNTVINAEPTYAWIGLAVRDEIIAKDTYPPYSAEMQVQGYSLDRLISMRRIVIPAIENGLTTLQSRCCASTLAYQGLKAQEEGKDIKRVWNRILRHEGNKLQLEYRPDLLIIPLIKDVKEVMKRLERRKAHEKYDGAIFETFNVQTKLKPLFEGKELRAVFEERGTVVQYLDASISPERTREQALKIYQNFLKSPKSQ